MMFGLDVSHVDIGQVLSVGVIGAIIAAVTLFIKVRPEADQIIVQNATQVVTSLREELDRAIQVRQRLEVEADKARATIDHQNTRIDNCLNEIHKLRSIEGAYRELERDVHRLGDRLEASFAARDAAIVRADAAEKRTLELERRLDALDQQTP